jgi:hypothetical protein
VADYQGGAGTIYLKSSSAQYGDLIVDNGGLESREDSTVLASVGQGVVSDISLYSLSVSDPVWTPGALQGLRFHFEDAPEVNFTISDNNSTTLFIDQIEGDLTQYASIGSLFSGEYRFENIAVLDRSQVRSLDPLVAVNEFKVDNSTLVVNNIHTQQLALQNGAELTHWPTTATRDCRLEIIADSVTVDAVSGIDTSARGYLGGRQPGNGSDVGRTLGNTIEGGSLFYAGGSYGGKGGLSSYGGPTTAANTIYGDLYNPNDLGSGGAGQNTSNSGYWGGNGGGLVRISADSILLDGWVKSDGGTSSYSGGGSGGGVWIETEELSGSGTISVDGGQCTYGSSGGGGGGRIAINALSFDFHQGTLSADGGLSSTGGVAVRNGQSGTIQIQ